MLNRFLYDRTIITLKSRYCCFCVPVLIYVSQRFIRFFFINPSTEALFPARFVPATNLPRTCAESPQRLAEEDVEGGPRSGRRHCRSAAVRQGPPPWWRRAAPGPD